MTKIYGRSDDLIEFEGDFFGEYGKCGTDESEHGVLCVVSDGTHLEVKYGKGGAGIWEVKLLKTGDLFDRIEPCEDEDADIYSDIAYLKDGVKWVIASADWERVK
ncbi:MAG: hypothetical protein PHX80_03785 [Candidatus Nanoarchaeia archaeon]|nr:hypothetical protein [Candidatus Nanoarchaeia archaeon]